MIVSVYLHSNIRGEVNSENTSISKRERMALQDHPRSLILAEIEYAYD